jgi:hypothetical protein
MNAITERQIAWLFTAPPAINARFRVQDHRCFSHDFFFHYISFPCKCKRLTDQAVPVIKERRCRDADDDSVIACALPAKAAYLVTGDDDLLEIKKYKGVRICRLCIEVI